MLQLIFLSILTTLFANVHAHTVITYPGWRGDNLVTNGTAPENDVGALVINPADGPNDYPTFPYGMQWAYPCGGMPMSTNRTLWPVKGGALAIQPGWFTGHNYAFFYVNVGINGPGDVAPPNMSHVVVPPFQIIGPDNVEYDGTFCLPQVPLPTNLTFNVGDNLTIQVIETAQHGAAIYNCVDITLAEPEDVAEVNSSNCFNSSDISFELVFTTTSLTGAGSLLSAPTSATIIVIALATLSVFGL